jgi:hypothetical protein
MKLRSLILLALVGAVLLGHVRESYAITTCNVCADGAHPCTFRCYTGPYDFPFVTTCGGAGYQCWRLPHASSSLQCDLAASTATADSLVTLAAGWIRGGLSLASTVAYRVAALDFAGASAAHS